MSIFLEKVKNILLYCGLSRENYNLDKEAFQKSNRKIVLGLSVLMMFLFLAITVNSIFSSDFSGGSPLFPVGTAVFVVFSAISICDRRGKTTTVLSALLRIFLYVYGLVQSLLINNKVLTVCLFVFLCAAPALFMARPITLIIEIIVTNIIYFALCDSFKDPVQFHSDKIWIIMYSLGGITIAMINLRQKINNIENARMLRVQSEKLELKSEELSEQAAELKEAYVKAEQANKAKSSFLSNMSHEIRTPINAVLGMDTMILRKCKDTEIRRYASDIQSAGKSLLAIINDILDFSKIESGKMELVPVDYEFSNLINDVFNMINTKAREKDLEFRMEIDSSLPCRLWGDDVRIRQVLINLLTNAVKYTPSGTVTLRVYQIEEALSENEAAVRFEIIDTGIGIKPEDIDKLTEEFVRIEESRNRNIEGTGLGINIVVSLLSLMGSKLEVSSVYGEGSTFSFTLIQKITHMECIGNIEERILKIQDNTDEYSASLYIPDANLLVVDDNAMNRSVFCSLLSDMKCNIDEADSGKKCLELVNDTKYDIIFMDHMMPEMDGVETLHHIKNINGCINYDTPVIILTANAISGAKEAYLAEGFVDFLSKPIDADKLEAMVAKYIPDEKKSSSNNLDGQSNEYIELPFIDGVDWNHAMMRLGDEVLLREIVKEFSVAALVDIKELNETFDEIRQSKQKELYNSFRIKVHSMKSTVATIGADHIAGIAKYMEYAAKDYDYDTIIGLMPLFNREWIKLKTEIDEAFELNKTSDENDKTLIDSRDLNMFLDALSEAMEEADFDRADAVVEELENYSFPVDQVSIFDNIKIYVLNLEVEKCDEMIAEWKKMIEF